MNFGYFDDEKREYVITRPDTPTPWANYLGSPEYGAIISNNAGGYSFEKSGANGRILRYMFNEFDRPGRYIYLRDNKSKEYWSASWQPVGKELKNYHNECRHGMSYTKMTAEYNSIHSEALYYVPLNQRYEVWSIKVTNISDEARELNVTGYAEFTNSNNYEMDQVNLQYSQFITRTKYDKNQIRHIIHGNLSGLGKGKSIDQKTVIERFFGMAASEVDSYCGDKAEFIGHYRDYHNPIGVEAGRLNGKLNYNGNGCGALTTVISLEPKESKTIVFLLGTQEEEDAQEILNKYTDADQVCERDIKKLQTYWNEKFSRFQVKTPSPEFNSMMNTWNAYNCFITFVWSRAASFTYCGLRNGYGYRDTVQDIQGIIHLAPDMAKEKIRFMLSAQVDNGGGLPLVKFTHNPGHENTPDDPSYVEETGHPSYRADDALWLFPTVYKYIAETGDTDFLNEVIPYANKDEDTVYDHLKRAIGFSLDRLGKHRLPIGLHADWNDCLRLGKEGESTFVAFQLYYAVDIIQLLGKEKEDIDYVKSMDRVKEKLSRVLEDDCWDGDRFIRGFTEKGKVIGRAADKEASLWLNPQSWSVISGYASEEQAELVLDRVYQELNTEYGAVLMDSPYYEEAFDGSLAVIYNAGTKENASVFSQSQGWIILAEAMKGHGNRAFTYFMENAPAAQNNKAEIRKLEPYCYGQFTEGKDSPFFGRSQVHWLTGTASTMMVGCVEGILGIRPDFAGLKIAPSIPKEWEELEITKEFRGKKLHIVIKNPEHKESGYSKIILNKKELKDNYIAEDQLDITNEIELTL